MTALLSTRDAYRFGLKGPGAAAWLAQNGVPVPGAANTWAGAARPDDSGVFVARLGIGEFFIEDGGGGASLRGIEPTASAHPTGVYPVLREDRGFVLSGSGADDLLAQVCNVNFGDLALTGNPVIMTLMIGVSVLVVPQVADGGRHYRIWCDPTYAAYLGRSLRLVADECGNNDRGVAS